MNENSEGAKVKKGLFDSDEELTKEFCQTINCIACRLKEKYPHSQEAQTFTEAADIFVDTCMRIRIDTDTKIVLCWTVSEFLQAFLLSFEHTKEVLKSISN